MSKYIYLRVSTDDQDEQRQIYQVGEYLKETKQKIEDFKVYTDIGFSGSLSIEKRSIGQIKTLLRPGDLIVCTETSRIGRRMLDRLIFVDFCDNMNVKIYNISQRKFVSMNGEDDGLLETFDSWADSNFLKKLRKATKVGVRAAMEKGVLIGAASPKYMANYTEEERTDKEKQRHEQKARTQNTNIIYSKEAESIFQSLILFVPELKEYAKKSNDNPFYINFHKVKFKFSKDILENVTDHLNTFCSQYFDKKIYPRHIRQRYYNLIGSLKKYEEFNKITNTK